MIIVIAALYLVLTFLLTVLGIERQMIGFQVFIVSLLLTPIVAFIYIYSNKNNSSRIRYYNCGECDYIYPVKMSNCPICMEKGVKVKLRKYQSPVDASKVVGVFIAA